MMDIIKVWKAHPVAGWVIFGVPAVAVLRLIEKEWR